MGALWFWIVAVMLTMYVVLDGFDIGVGIVYPLVARSEQDKRRAMASIGPVWDGNEVWLLAGGGTLFFAFPLLYASSFSGFYLPLMMVLWLLILRALSLEMRGRIGDSVIRSFCSGTFFVSSALLAIFYGAAFANVLRGVPLAADGTFFLPMWTNWRPGADPGILDWYTVLGGVLALCALAMHGLLYLVMKTDGPMQAASRRWARNILPAVFLLTIVGIPATVAARPDSLHNYANHSILWVFPAIVLLSLVSIGVSLAKRCEVSAFLSSCVYLAMMMVSAVIGVYPVVLPSVAGHGPDITIERALTSPQALRMGLVWWVIGILLAAFYFVTIYWIFRGKVSEHSEGYGH